MKAAFLVCDFFYWTIKAYYTRNTMTFFIGNESSNFQLNLAGLNTGNLGMYFNMRIHFHILNEIQIINYLPATNYQLNLTRSTTGNLGT